MDVGIVNAIENARAQGRLGELKLISLLVQAGKFDEAAMHAESYRLANPGSPVTPVLLDCVRGLRKQNQPLR